MKPGRVQLTDYKVLERKMVNLGLISLMLYLFVLALQFIPTLHASESDAIQEILSLDADAEYGEYLAGECLTCHQVTGAAAGVPVVARLPADYIVTALLDYKTGVRENQVMHSVANNLGNEEIAALALYFSTIDSQ